MSKVSKTPQKEIEALMNVPDEDIDTSDIPPVDVEEWREKAIVGKFYRPIKQPVTIRLDSDVVAWFKSHHPKYQRAVNKVLRKYMESHSNI